MSVSPVRWGILATGNIAAQFAADLVHANNSVLAGAASRDPAKAAAFCATHGGTASDSYQALIERDDIDAIYVATPHDSHVTWAKACLDAGKPVLCEKPLGLNQGEALSLYGAAERAGTLLVEALMYLMHPRMHLAKKLIDEGAIGTPTGFHSSFGFAFPYTPEHRLYDPARGGGSIVDIGIYPLTAARYLLGEPASLTAEARLTPDQVDAETHAKLAYDGFEARLACSIDTEMPWEIRVTGDAGTLLIEQPWHPGPDNQQVKIIAANGDETVHASQETRPLYAVEADHVAALIAQKAAASGLVSPAFSTNTAYWMDRWRQQVGVHYAADTLAAPGFFGQAVRVANDGPLGRAAMPGLDKPVSRLMLGTDNQIDAPTMAAMADAFVEAGGNAFDTAYIYSGGDSEALLGQWMRARGIRDDLVIMSKGAHPPECTPEAVGRQLETTLERLQTNYLDLYCLHRDNPDVPVDEWLDALNQQVAAGRIKQFGGSNWTAARVDEANARAAARGQQGFALLSNNFSLARMEQPVWDGCLASSTDAFRDWHAAHAMPLFPWSSQARGFFLDWQADGLAASRHGADPTLDEMHRVWGSEANLQRRSRAFELAQQLGVSAIQIALAYVLHQPFPTFALIGPRTIGQLDDSIAASNITLTPEQVAWLDLRD